MTIADLVKKVSISEGNKSQVSVGNIREILGIISDTLALEFEMENPKWEGSTLQALVKNGQRRKKAKKQVMEFFKGLISLAYLLLICFGIYSLGKRNGLSEANEKLQNCYKLVVKD